MWRAWLLLVCLTVVQGQDCAAIEAKAKADAEGETEAETDIVLDIFLPLLVIVLMFGMGAAVSPGEFRRQVSNWRAVVIGMCSQFLFMPIMTACLAALMREWFDMSTKNQIALMIIGSSPGGSTSNLFAFWANGDVALSITMTTCSTVMALVMQPAILWVAIQLFDKCGTLQPAWIPLFLALMVVVVPVGCGVCVNHYFPKRAPIVTRVGSIVGFLVIILLIVYGGITQSEMFDSGPEIYISSVCLGLFGFVFGFGVSWLAGLRRKHQRTVALETGIQNGVLAIAVVELAFPNETGLITLPLFYSFWIVMESMIVALCFRKFPVYNPPPADLIANQVDTIKDGQEVIYRCKGFGDGLLDGMPDVGDAEAAACQTLADTFDLGAKRYANKKCLGWRDHNDKVCCGCAGQGNYKWMTFKAVHEHARSFARGLAELGLKKGAVVGIMSKNRREWTIADLGCQQAAYVSVPLYDTYGNDALKYIVKLTKIQALVVSPDHEELVEQLNCPSLRHIIYMDMDEKANTPAVEELQESEDDSESEDEDTDISDFLEPMVHSFMEVVANGRTSSRKLQRPKKGDLFTICFTSGTTGTPKGVMMTHGNFVSNMGSAVFSMSGGLTNDKSMMIGPGDSYLSFLPAAHAFERLLQSMAMFTGMHAGYYSGETTMIMDDIMVLKPTLFAAVPRLLNRLYDRVNSKVESQDKYVDCTVWPPFPRLSRWLYHKGFAKKEAMLEKGHFEDGFWDSVVFSNIAQRLGGRVRIMITGSAPLDARVMKFLRICFSCHVLEGYGQTETGAASHVTIPGDVSLGHVGCPLPCNEIKLDPVEEMGFSPKNDPPTGEVCFRGHNITKGYFKNMEKTDEAIDDDGWLHSGDIGRINANGTLSIIDRKKNIFKLAQGEYVAPEKCEKIYTSSEYIQQCLVHGDSLQSYLVAIVVVDPDNVPETQALDSEFKAKILEEMVRFGKEAGLKGFEQVRSILLTRDAFTPENGLATPTMKVKRRQVVEKYRNQIDAMYDGESVEADDDAEEVEESSTE